MKLKHRDLHGQWNCPFNSFTSNIPGDLGDYYETRSSLIRYSRFRSVNQCIQQKRGKNNIFKRRDRVTWELCATFGPYGSIKTSVKFTRTNGFVWWRNRMRFYKYEC